VLPKQDIKVQVAEVLGHSAQVAIVYCVTCKEIERKVCYLAPTGIRAAHYRRDGGGTAPPHSVVRPTNPPFARLRFGRNIITFFADSDQKLSLRQDNP
jgi:hypothetical protein